MKKFLLFCLLTAAVVSGAAEKGAVCFTFDDYAGTNWLKADALFKKYKAHVTFFVSGVITPEKAAVMKKLQAAGHSIGLHTLRHRNAFPLPAQWSMTDYFEKEIRPQLESCKAQGVKISGFAYPNNRRNEKTDAELFKHFDYLRAGVGKGRKILLYQAGEIKKKMVLGGAGIGVYYKSDINVLKKYLKQTAEANAMIVFFSHNIYPGAKGVNMPTEMLEELLKTASELNMRVIGIDEIKTLKLR